MQGHALGLDVGLARPFGEFVGQHEAGAVDPEVGVHQPLAVLGGHPHDLFGAEGPPVEFDGRQAAL
ncbi:hypothetical protein D3C85_1426540 [compost metagenome]